jgi:hypothetical protein
LNLAQSALWAVPGFSTIYNPAVMRDSRVAIYNPEGDAFAETFLIYDQIAALARQYDVPVVVAMLPDHLQVLSRELLASMDMERPQRLLGSYLDSIGLAHVDLLPAILQAPDPAALYYAKDKHWTAAGHAFAADMLARWLDAPRGP